MPAKKKKIVSDEKNKVDSVIATGSDGSIQITFTISRDYLERERNQTLKELAQEIEVPGFRKGKVPLEKAKEFIPNEKLVEKTLSKILTFAYPEALKKHNITPAVYPRFELIKANENEDWQVRTTTCNLPKITLGDYKSLIQGEARSAHIWTPEKGGEKDKSRIPTKEEKENIILETLSKQIQVEIPGILIKEEVDARLSRLLERIEKLGLSLESYLQSIDKSIEEVRSEYEKQARDSIKIELILNEIVKNEKINVATEELNEMVNTAYSSTKQNPNEVTDDQKRMFETVIMRRKALDLLVALI